MYETYPLVHKWVGLVPERGTMNLLIVAIGLFLGMYARKILDLINRVLPQSIGCSLLSWHLPLIDRHNGTLVKGFPPHTTSLYAFTTGTCPRCEREVTKRTGTVFHYGNIKEDNKIWN